MWLGLQTVSSLERCPIFGLSFIERFHGVSVHTSVCCVSAEENRPGPAGVDGSGTFCSIREVNSFCMHWVSESTVDGVTCVV